MFLASLQLSTIMRRITEDELIFIAQGNTVLGSGGGGNPDYELLKAKHAISQYGSPYLAQIDEFEDQDLILPIAYMGAPLVFQEKLAGSREFETLIEKVKSDFGQKPKGLIALEIGGFNGLVAISVAARLDIPVIDGDTMGRAFPELQMSSCHVHGISIAPAYIADGIGNVVRIETTNAKMAEKIARHVCVSMGSACAIALYPMKAIEAKQAIIQGTISQSISIGKALKTSLDFFMKNHTVKQHAIGTIIDIDQAVKDGFLTGSVTIASGEDQTVVEYKNEYLIVRQNGKTLSATPDIIAILEHSTGIPLTSEMLRFGLKVSLVSLPSPTIWKNEGYHLVSPQNFGYQS